MCIIIYKEAGLIIPPETLREAWKHNPHGGGFAYWHNNIGWMVRKGFMKLREFTAAFAESVGDREAVIHFRIATHGTVSPENCHPFGDPERDEPVLFHNGVMGSFGSRDLSDTGHFYDSVLKHIPLKAGRFNLLSAMASGTGSKFALLEEDGNITLIGGFKKYLGLEVSNMSLVPEAKAGRKHAGRNCIGLCHDGMEYDACMGSDDCCTPDRLGLRGTLYSSWETAKDEPCPLNVEGVCECPSRGKCIVDSCVVDADDERYRTGIIEEVREYFRTVGKGDKAHA